MSESLHLREMFTSIQGEGTICLGRRQVFVRLAGCNMLCKYCDTDFKRSEFCNVFTESGSLAVELLANPVSTEQLADVIARIAPPDTHSVSITGGEPLFSPIPAVRALFEAIRSRGLKVYLETNGTLPKQLRQVIDVVDFVCMDVKPPSATEKKTKYWDAHRTFLDIARAVPTCVKFVAYPGQIEELTTAVQVIADADPEIDFVIQPETNRLKHLAGETANTWIWEFLEVASQRLTNVHVIPQTHAFLNLQ